MPSTYAQEMPTLRRAGIAGRVQFSDRDPARSAPVRQIRRVGPPGPSRPGAVRQIVQEEEQMSSGGIVLPPAAVVVAAGVSVAMVADAAAAAAVLVVQAANAAAEAVVRVVGDYGALLEQQAAGQAAAE